jgi:hypothetical protein
MPLWLVSLVLGSAATEGKSFEAGDEWCDTRLDSWTWVPQISLNVIELRKKIIERCADAAHLVCSHGNEYGFISFLPLHRVRSSPHPSGDHPLGELDRFGWPIGGWRYASANPAKAKRAELGGNQA